MCFGGSKPKPAPALPPPQAAPVPVAPPPPPAPAPPPEPLGSPDTKQKLSIGGSRRADSTRRRRGANALRAGKPSVNTGGVSGGING